MLRSRTSDTGREKRDRARIKEIEKYGGGSEEIGWGGGGAEASVVGEGGAYGVELVAEVIGNRRWRRHRLGLKSRCGNRAGRAGPGH